MAHTLGVLFVSFFCRLIFVFAVSDKANEIIRFSFKFSELRALMKQQVAFLCLSMRVRSL